MGDLLDILRALLLPGFNRGLRRGVRFVALGTLSGCELAALLARFVAARPSARGMTENVRVTFVPARALRDACLAPGADEGGGWVPGLRDYECLRHVLVGVPGRARRRHSRHAYWNGLELALRRLIWCDLI